MIFILFAKYMKPEMFSSQTPSLYSHTQNTLATITFLKNRSIIALGFSALYVEPRSSDYVKLKSEWQS